MRDLLFPESVARRALGATLLRTFALYGYDLVTTPPFEHEDVMERGLAGVDPRDLLRFVEPDSGEVALIRPDITPQIARIVATSLRDRPPPWRLAYDGTVVRRRRGRARRQRQIAQAGAECIGLGGPAGDAEVITLAVAACRAAGLASFRVELSQAGLGRAALAALPEEVRAAAGDALARKDAAELKTLLAGASEGARAGVLRLLELEGAPDEVLREARARFHGADENASLDALDAVLARLDAVGIARDTIGIDLSDVRGASYYTGVSFTVLAHGPGEPVAAGGRYDGLLARFGHAAPATGFALDLENLAWALADAGVPSRAPRTPRVVVIADGADAQALAAALRELGATAAAYPAGTGDGEDEGLAYARAWGYDAVVRAGATARALRTDGTRATLPSGASLETARAVLAFLGVAGGS